MSHLGRVVLSLLAALLLGGAVVAAPMPPVLVANPETRQCAEVFGGDECMDCSPPPGWESVGVAGDVQCPEGYTFVTDLEVTCTPFQNEFCCSEGHSGAPGDCDNLVVNARGQECAFVADAAACVLPRGWGRPEADPASGGLLCPAGYAWVTDVACAAGGETPTAGQEGGAGAQAGETGRGLCPGAALVSPLFLAGVVLARRRSAG